MTKRLTQEAFVERVTKIHDGNLVVIGTYSTGRDAIQVRCRVCGHEWERNSQSCLRRRCKTGHGCKKCYTKAQSMSHEEFVRRLKEKHGDSIEVVSNYSNIYTKITVHCNKCGESFNIRPNSLLAGHGCLCTSRNHVVNKQRKESFSDDISDLTRDEYKVMSDYISEYSYVDMQHASCGAVFPVTPHNFVYNGSRCPYCKESKGERTIRQCLTDAGLSFERQYKFTDCKNKAPLPFDFAVFSESQLYCLIEFDGKQHSEPIDAWGGEENLLRTQENDRIKDEYCVANGIKLIRIDYRDFDNIEEILTVQLAELLTGTNRTPVPCTSILTGPLTTFIPKTASTPDSLTCS